MQKIKLVLQFLIRFFLIFLLVFIWAKFFTKDYVISLILSIMISLLAEIVLKIITKKTTIKKDLKLKEKENAENMFLTLATGKSAILFFKKLASKRHLIKANKKYITVVHEDKNVILYPFFNLSPLSPNDINNIVQSIKNETYKKVVISCGEISKDCINFVKIFNEEIVLLDKYETYKQLYKEYDCFPEITASYKKDKKATLKELACYSFNRSRTKGYLFSAIVLIFSSFFVRLNLYYCIISSLMVIFALISFLNPFEKHKKAPFSL